MKLNPAYKAIKSVADKTGIIKAFRTDLTKHDKKDIEENPTSKFIWFMYPCGTWLYHLPEDNVRLSIDPRTGLLLEASHYGVNISVEMIFNHFPVTKNYTFFWDGSGLHHITADQAIKIQDQANRGAQNVN